MKYYYAGGNSTKFRTILKKCGVKRILLTYADYYNKEDNLEKILDEIKGMELFMDCGAYSAWTKGFTIEVEKYADFIMRYKKHIHVFASLDVKGSLELTNKNLKKLQSAGLKPIPVYHLTEGKWEVLRDLIDHYDYIALGAIAGENNTRKGLLSNLDMVFSMAKRSPVTKFHGFGMTILDVMKRYPFYSVDSTSWLQSVAYGRDITKNAITRMYIKKRELEKNLIPTICEIEKRMDYITKLWKGKGISWEK